MQVDAVHVDVNHERQGSGSDSRSDKGKVQRKGKSKKGSKGKEKDEKSASNFEGECRYCLKKGHKNAECRKMKADLAAGKCDKNGKPTGVNSLTATRATQPSPQASSAPSLASTIPMLQMVPVYSPNTAGSQASQQTETWFINMIVPAQLGRSRIRVVGFWLRLDVLPNQCCQQHPIVAATCKPANLEERH